MDTQGADAHSTVTEPTNCLQRWRKCNKYCRYTPSIVSRAKTTYIFEINMHIHHLESIGRWLVVHLVNTPFCPTFHTYPAGHPLMHPCGLLGYLA